MQQPVAAGRAHPKKGSADIIARLLKAGKACFTPIFRKALRCHPLRHWKLMEQIFLNDQFHGKGCAMDAVGIVAIVFPVQSFTVSWKPRWWHLYWESAGKLGSPRVMHKWQLLASAVPQGSVSAVQHLWTAAWPAGWSECPAWGAVRVLEARGAARGPSAGWREPQRSAQLSAELCP